MYQQSITVINIKKLKKFAYERLPKDSALRDYLLTEEDEIPVNEFLVEVKTWLKLLRLSGSS